MNYLMSFLFAGFVCAISQFILEKTKLTPGHINTILVVTGCILSGFKIYDILLDKFYSGASVLIVNFGHLLVSGASKLYNTEGFIGLFKGVFLNASAGISITIFISFIITLLFKIKH